MTAIIEILNGSYIYGNCVFYCLLFSALCFKKAEGRRGHKLVLNFQSPKEKLITEEITLVNSKRDKLLTLFLHARILGQWQFLRVLI